MSRLFSDKASDADALEERLRSEYRELMEAASTPMRRSWLLAIGSPLWLHPLSPRQRPWRSPRLIGCGREAVAASAARPVFRPDDEEQGSDGSGCPRSGARRLSGGVRALSRGLVGTNDAPHDAPPAGIRPRPRRNRVSGGAPANPERMDGLDADDAHCEHAHRRRPVTAGAVGLWADHAGRAPRRCSSGKAPRFRSSPRGRPSSRSYSRRSSPSTRQDPLIQDREKNE